MRRIHNKEDKKYLGHPSPEEINETNETNEIELERISRSKHFDAFYEFTDKAVSFILIT